MTKFKLESKISSGSSEITFFASYDGDRCHSEEVVGKISKKRLALELITGDLYSCVEYLSLIKGCDGLRINKPIYEAFVIKYGKCFASGKERGLSLKIKDYFNDNPALLKTHLHVINTRNKYIAHSDSSVFEQGEVLLAKNGSESEVFVPVCSYSYPVGHFLEKEIELCSYLISKINLEIKKLENRIKA